MYLISQKRVLRLSWNKLNTMIISITVQKL